MTHTEIISQIRAIFTEYAPTVSWSFDTEYWHYSSRDEKCALKVWCDQMTPQSIEEPVPERLISRVRAAWVKPDAVAKQVAKDLGEVAQPPASEVTP